MGARFRNKRADPDYVPSRNLVAAHNMVDTGPQDMAPIYGGTSDDTTMAADGFPLPVEVQHVMAQARDADYPSRQYTNHDPIDYEVGGQRGQVDGVPYSTGVVSSDLVENFALTGEQANIRRQYNPASTGPVGTSDSNALLGMALAQAANQFYPGEVSQADVVYSV